MTFASRPLRVVIDARVPDGLYGGVQQWIIGLANALSRLDSAEEEYFFLVDPGRHAWLDPYLGGRSRLLVRPGPSTLRRAFGRLRRGLSTIAGGPVGTPPFRLPPRSDGAIERAHADVVHFPMQAAFLTDVPSLYQPWDLQHLHLPQFFTDEQRRWREVTYRAFCAQASVIITATGWVKADVAHQYGIDPGRIVVVNVPPATAAYATATPEVEARIAARLALPERYVFYPAQTWPHKNHGRLLEALARLRSEGLRIPLVCSGHVNEHQPALVGEAARLGLADDVRFLGFLRPEEVQVLYRRARALVFPSLYEGWGLPIVEAFLADLPVACSTVTSLPELVGDAALLFDPLDPAAIATAIRLLWTEDVLAVELASRGRIVVGRLDWNRTARTLRALYRMVGGRILTSDERELLAARPIT